MILGNDNTRVAHNNWLTLTYPSLYFPPLREAERHPPGCRIDRDPASTDPLRSRPLSTSFRFRRSSALRESWIQTCGERFTGIDNNFYLTKFGFLHICKLIVKIIINSYTKCEASILHISSVFYILYLNCQNSF